MDVSTKYTCLTEKHVFGEHRVILFAVRNGASYSVEDTWKNQKGHMQQTLINQHKQTPFKNTSNAPWHTFMLQTRAVFQPWMHAWIKCVALTHFFEFLQTQNEKPIFVFFFFFSFSSFNHSRSLATENLSLTFCTNHISHFTALPMLP